MARRTRTKTSLTSPPIEIRAGGLRPPVDRRRQVFVLEKSHNLRDEIRPRRGTVGAGQSTFRISFPARLGAGEEANEGACASRTEFIRHMTVRDEYSFWLNLTNMRGGVGAMFRVAAYLRKRTV